MSRFARSKMALVPITALSLVFAGVVALAGRLFASPPVRFDDVIRLEFVVLDDETSKPLTRLTPTSDRSASQLANRASPPQDEPVGLAAPWAGDDCESSASDGSTDLDY